MAKKTAIASARISIGHVSLAAASVALIRFSCTD
jgi:hypothetical protein